MRRIDISADFVLLVEWLHKAQKMTWPQMGLKDNKFLGRWQEKVRGGETPVAELETLVAICRALNYCGANLQLPPATLKALEDHFSCCDPSKRPNQEKSGFLSGLAPGWKHDLEPTTGAGPIGSVGEMADPKVSSVACAATTVNSGQHADEGALVGGPAHPSTNRPWKPKRVLGLLAAAVAMLVTLTALVPRPDLVTKANEMLSAGNWLCYDPSTFVPENEIAGHMPSVEEIGEDLRVLHGVGRFDGLVTFGTDGTLRQIPRLAKEAGFRWAIAGIYVSDDSDKTRQQVENAIAEQDYVDAYIVGHLPAATDDKMRQKLQDWIKEVRSRTNKPVSTTMPYVAYLGPKGEWVRGLGDFLCPDIAPGTWQNGSTPNAAFDELDEKVQQLSNVLPPNKGCLLKMASYPSNGAEGLTEQNQKIFYERLYRDLDLPHGICWSFFAAFDPAAGAKEGTMKSGAKWSSPEKHVGLFTNDRHPKLAIRSDTNPNEPPRGSDLSRK